jgi:asparagine synthase (glutamine-hydrolysing)
VCGICGIITQDTSAGHPKFTAAVRRMSGLMARRGPDDEGFWASTDGHASLGFRRLSILDLTPAGRQPMVASDGGSVIVFNGEIYNYAEVRRQLEQEGVRFRSRTDTEVLLEALSRWGVAAVSRLNGMFAFGWYNLRERTLLLARDHAGIKPLYYLAHPSGKGLAFASQYNALLNTPWGIPGAVRADVLRLYLRLHHIPAPYALYANTHQLEPGHYLIVQPDGTFQKRAWWTMPREGEPELRGEAAVEALAGAVQGAVRRQRVADVPLGVFLSGGVDSPLVTAVLRQQTGPGLRAFTIGSPGWRQDESEAATTHARSLDVDHRLRAASGAEALATVPDVVGAQHEPFADFSILPTLQVSRLARAEVTVALSGDGGDELFFGYERPVSLLRNGIDFRWPWPLRVALYATGKYGLGARRSRVILARTPGHYYFEVNSRVKDTDLRRFAPDLAAFPPEYDLYRFDGPPSRERLAGYSRWVEFYGQLQRVLKKVDMASMHHGLEARVPLLDREVIETALRIDPLDCMRNGSRKAVLRDLLARHVPPETILKPKLGFAVPLGDWLKGHLRPLVEETLFNGPLFPENAFDRQGLRRYWQDHLDGRHDRKWGVWTLLALQWWGREHARESQSTAS